MSPQKQRWYHRRERYGSWQWVGNKGEQPLSVDLYVKLRDAHQMLADAYNEHLEKMVPSEVNYGEKDFDSLKWEMKSGTKGDYQQTTKEANDNNEVFQALKQILQDHKGFWQSPNYKFWVHSGNPDVIDRRLKKTEGAQR